MRRVKVRSEGGVVGGRVEEDMSGKEVDRE